MGGGGGVDEAPGGASGLGGVAMTMMKGRGECDRR